MRKHIYLICIICILFIPKAIAFEYSWQIDKTPEGQESSTVIQPINIVILDEPIRIADNSAAIRLLKKYSVHIGQEWDTAHASRLLSTFESITQATNDLRGHYTAPNSVFILTNRHITNDIEIAHHEDVRLVTISSHAFVYATPFLAEIDGLRGRYFSKRLHRAIVRFVTDNGKDRNAVKWILRDRYDVSIEVPDYTELTKDTTGEHAGRFQDFKNEEIIALLSMLEEFPTGMLKIPGLNYLVRRLDGTPHPVSPTAPAVAWTQSGYIEFMETAFQEKGLDFTHRLVLHEKAHFLWDFLFDDQLKADWIELGGWYENPDDIDGWSTTKQHEFVSAYAHAIDPNEDMAESISFYIVRPDALRSRAPAKYEFIRDRIMHGTRYISQIREDLTFEVYNLYPDYVYPGKIKQINIKVEGGPEEDKRINVELIVHRYSDLDAVGRLSIRVFSEKGTYFDLQWRGNIETVPNGQILRSHAVLSKYAPNGYWTPDQIRLWDDNGNERLSSIVDFGWKLYIDNPLADCEPPKYIPNSMKLSLSKETTPEGLPYQVVTAEWKVAEKSGIDYVRAYMNDTFGETYSQYGDTRYRKQVNTVMTKIIFPEYMPSGMWKVNRLFMRDIARNTNDVYFTDAPNDELPQTIVINTANPDYEPPVLDVNNITIKATPTTPEAPNGETQVDITFFVKDNISGYAVGSLNLRDPQGITHHFYHNSDNKWRMYFKGDPTVYKEYRQSILLPVGSVPGIWGLSHIEIYDKADNIQRYDFTEIVRFEVTDEPKHTNGDLNGDGEINIQDLVIVANAIGTKNAIADLNGDGEVNILDLVVIANLI